MSLPRVGLILYPHFSPFHFSVPYMVFGTPSPEGPCSICASWHRRDNS